MIEQRAILMKNMRFEGGFKLACGTPIYVRQVEEWWLGSYYTDKGTCHSFNIEPEQFSILISSDIGQQELVVIPDPPDPPEAIKDRQNMERKQIENRIKRHRDEADRLESIFS